MNAMQIDFARPGWRRSLRQAPRWTWIALLAGLVLLGAAALRWSSSHAAEQALLADLARIDSQLARTRNKDSEHVAQVRAALPSVQAANGVITQLNTPWFEALDALEHANGASIALLELSPDRAHARIRGTAEARNVNAMTAYIEAVKAAPMFGTAWLKRHEWVQAEDGTVSLRFDFEIDWPGAAR
ncbi:MAG: hypothetical protein JO370_13500 [Paucibacter sp.]|nr:hypothetical protein [Roseateles sp.]